MSARNNVAVTGPDGMLRQRRRAKGHANFNPRSASLFSLAVLLTLLSGCAPLYEGKYAFADGWRKGRSVKISDAAAVPRPGYWQCLRQAPPGAQAKAPYAIVRYSGFGRARQRLVPVHRDLELRENEAVYVNLGRCEDAIVIAAPQSARKPDDSVPSVH
jgi:hypothetical protein